MNRKGTKDCDVHGCLGGRSEKTSEKRVGFLYISAKNLTENMNLKNYDQSFKSLMEISV